MLPIVIVPGRGGSGPAHWQSELERRLPAVKRVEQRDWDQPDLALWSTQVETEIAAMDTPPLVIAHSFGCLALAHALLYRHTRVSAAFMVAPADPARFAVDDALLFDGLPVSTELIASTNDPWLTPEKARRLAAAWGSRLHILGAVGHINVESGFGVWPEMLKWATIGSIDSIEYLVEPLPAAI